MESSGVTLEAKTISKLRPGGALSHRVTAPGCSSGRFRQKMQSILDKMKQPSSLPYGMAESGVQTEGRVRVFNAQVT